MNNDIQFVVDDKGARTAVIIDLNKYAVISLLSFGSSI